MNRFGSTFIIFSFKGGILMKTVGFYRFLFRHWIFDLAQCTLLRTVRELEHTRLEPSTRAFRGRVMFLTLGIGTFWPIRDYTCSIIYLLGGWTNQYKFIFTNEINAIAIPSRISYIEKFGDNWANISKIIENGHLLKFCPW